MRARCAGLLCLWGVMLLAAPHSASAQQCGEGPSIVVTFVGEAWADDFRSQVRRELFAAVENQGFSVCRGGESDDVVAHIELSTNDLPRVAVTIEVRDEVTEKQLRRDVDLAEFTEDSRALALAVSADELLRASWMELALEDAPPTRRRPPREVTRVVEREVERSRPRRTELGVAFATRAYTEGVLLLGADAYVAYWVNDLFGVELSFGVGFGLEETSDNGRVTTRALGAAPGLLLRLFEIEPLALLLRGGVRVDQVEFDGDPNVGAVGRTDSGTAVSARLSVIGRIEAGPLWLRLELGGGGVLRSVGAADDGVRAFAVGGAELHGRFGLGVAL